MVERASAWLHQFERLRIRYERCADLHRDCSNRPAAMTVRSINPRTRSKQSLDGRWSLGLRRRDAASSSLRYRLPQEWHPRPKAPSRHSRLRRQPRSAPASLRSGRRGSTSATQYRKHLRERGQWPTPGRRRGGRRAWRQSRRIFQCFTRARGCSTSATASGRAQASGGPSHRITLHAVADATRVSRREPAHGEVRGTVDRHQQHPLAPHTPTERACTSVPVGACGPSPTPATRASACRLTGT